MRIIPIILMIFLLSSFYFFISPDKVYADNLKLLGYDIGCDPGKPLSQGGCGLSHFLKFITHLIEFLITIAIPIAVIFIVYGGFVIMTAGGSEERLKRGRHIITVAVIGLIIVLTSWLIIITLYKILPIKQEFLPK